MYLLLFIIGLVAVLILQTFFILSTAIIFLDTDRTEFGLVFYWMYPFVRARVTMLEYTPLLTVYLFNIRVFRKKLKVKAGKTQTPSLQSIALSDISLTTCFGLESPFFTGILSGMAELIEGTFQNAAIRAYPDFLSEREYLTVQGSAKLNIGKTIWQAIKTNWKTFKTKRSDYHGSTQYV